MVGNATVRCSVTGVFDAGSYGSGSGIVAVDSLALRTGLYVRLAGAGG